MTDIERELVEQIADMARAHLVEHHHDPMCRRSAEYIVERADFLLGVTT